MTPLELHRLAVEYYEAIGTDKQFQIQTLVGEEWITTPYPSFGWLQLWRRKPEPRVVYFNKLDAYRPSLFYKRESVSTNDNIGRFVEDLDWDGSE